MPSLRLMLCCTAALLLLAGTASASEPDAVLIQSASPDAVVVVSDAAVGDPVSVDFPQPSQDQSRPAAGVTTNVDCGYCSVWSKCGLNSECWFSMVHSFCTVPQGVPPCESCYDSGSCIM